MTKAMLADGQHFPVLENVYSAADPLGLRGREHYDGWARRIDRDFFAYEQAGVRLRTRLNNIE